MDLSDFDQGLSAQISEVFQQNPDIPDHRKKHPWLTGGLGNPFSNVWFIAENPSLTMVERARNPDGGCPTPEAQWYASKGDRLFREALVLAKFKEGEWNSLGGWNCYITNIIKEADYVKRWNTKGTQHLIEAAEVWAPVLEWQIAYGRPKLIILMGKKVQKIAHSLGTKNLIQLPETRPIDHYSYVAFRAKRIKGKAAQGPMHPERVSAYLESIALVNSTTEPHY